MKKHKICLILRNNPGWTGGTEYIKNIFFAFSFLSKKERKKIELHLILLKINKFNYLKKYCDYYIPIQILKNFIRKYFILKKYKVKEFIFASIVIYKQKNKFCFPLFQITYHLLELILHYGFQIFNIII